MKMLLLMLIIGKKKKRHLHFDPFKDLLAGAPEFLSWK